VTVVSNFVVLALCNELGIGEGPIITRVIDVVVRTGELVNVGRLQADHCQLFNDVSAYFLPICGAWKFAGKPLSISMFLPSPV
jgi:hypothetical protein